MGKSLPGLFELVCFVVGVVLVLLFGTTKSKPSEVKRILFDVYQIDLTDSGTEPSICIEVNRGDGPSCRNCVLTVDGYRLDLSKSDEHYTVRYRVPAETSRRVCLDHRTALVGPGNTIKFDSGSFPVGHPRMRVVPGRDED